MAIKPTNIGSKSEVHKTTQEMGNRSYDSEFDVNVVEALGYDGVNLQRPMADSLAVKMTEVGNVTYIAQAKPGTAEATAKWQAKKLDQSSGLVITWADGDADFNNVATDLTSLSYS